MPVLLLLPVFVSEDALLLYNSSLFVPLLQDQGLSVACISVYIGFYLYQTVSCKKKGGNYYWERVFAV